MFAAANPDPTLAWNVVLTLGILLSIGVSLTTLIRSGRTQCRQIEPQPLKVELAKEFAARADLARLEAAVHEQSEKRSAMYARIEEIRRETKEDLSSVYGRIELVRSELGRRMDDLPERIVRLLKGR